MGCPYRTNIKNPFGAHVGPIFYACWVVNLGDGYLHAKHYFLEKKNKKSIWKRRLLKMLT